MLERMRKLLKREKGFTLVELLAVIAILAIILAIAIPSIGKVISNSEDKAHEANVELIENAARLAALADNETGNAEYDLDTLVSEGYLEELPEEVGGITYGGEDEVKVEDSKATYTKFRDENGEITKGNGD